MRKLQRAEGATYQYSNVGVWGLGGRVAEQENCKHSACSTDERHPFSQE